MRDEDWNDPQVRCFGMLLEGRAQPTGLRQRGQDATLLAILNAHFETVEVTLPAAGDRQAEARWVLLLDTSLEVPAHTDETNAYDAGARYSAVPRSLLLFKLES
jgi:isoamylase